MNKGNTYFTRKYIIKYLSDHHCYCCYHGDRITDDMILYDLTNKEVLDLVNIVTGHTFNEKGWFIMNESFSKSDLKNRMVVELYDGKKYLVIDNFLIGEHGFCSLDKFSNNLRSSIPHFPDVVRVFDCVYVTNALKQELTKRNYVNSFYNPELLWEREEAKEVTMAEVEEKFGCKVKIVNG